MGRTKRAEAHQWTATDSALWQTCSFAADLLAGRELHAPAPLATTWPPRIGAGEEFLVGGPYWTLVWASPGDGVYQHSSGSFVASGIAGLAATAVVGAGRAIGNASRRSAARQLAQPRLMIEGQGDIVVSTHGVYLATGSGVFPWPWSSITSLALVQPGRLDFGGFSTRGQVRWTIDSVWAELVFVLWALTCHPGHPQLAAGGWLPPGWLEWARSQGRSTDLTTS